MTQRRFFLRRGGSRGVALVAHRRVSVSRLLGAAVVALCCAASPVWGQSEAISPAETLLFMSPHLKQVAPPSRLRYSFLKTGSLEKGFTDSIDVDFTSEPDGSVKGVTRFFTGPRQIPCPDVEHAEGNPVLLHYLEREIHEMARLTGGKPNYFRKRIRLALAESAQIKPVDIKYGGQTIAAQQVTILPYENDPERARFERLATKRYVFTFSDKVPGSVYQLRGTVPGADAAAREAVLDETLTLKSAGAPK
jgi:hypothetical protein